MVAIFDHVEVDDGLTDLATQAFFKFVGFELDPGFQGVDFLLRFQ